MATSQGNPVPRKKAPDVPYSTRRAAVKAIEQLMKETHGKQNELRILVTGKTGQGKSALINGILGAHVSKEGASAARVTTEVEVISKVINGVPIKVFDSPGLQDRTANEKEYIQGMREQCQELSMILYCTKMTNPRLTDDDKNAMTKLTKAFGEHFWDYAVFVLTFANMENVERKDDRDEDDTEPDDDDEPGWEKLMKKRFEGRLKIWEEGLHDFLINEVNVSPLIAKGIPIVPTGDRRQSRTNKEPLQLPDRVNWFSDFWETCCLRIKDTRLFLKVNSSRMVTDEDSEEDTSEEDSSEDEAMHDIKSGYTIQEKMEQFQQLSQQATPVPQPGKPRRMKLRTAGEVGIPGLQMDALLPQTQRKAYPLAEPPNGDLSNMDIHFDRELVEEVVEQSAKKAGLDDAVTNKAMRAIQHMKKPVKWLKGLFK